MGTLRIKGVIDLRQFWPLGKSDADTTKIKLNVTESSFQFRSNANRPFRATDSYFGGFVVQDGVLTRVVKYVTTKSPHINVRLQGIDAPELHYKLYGRIRGDGLSKAQYETLKAVNKEAEYRQYFSETATVELERWLRSCSNGADLLPCEFESESIMKPGDAIDVYGRFVGDIYVMTPRGVRTSINRWLVTEGWVFPAFYESMTAKEIRPIAQAYLSAKKKRTKRTVHHYTPTIGTFDYALRFRDPKDKPLFDPKKDTGKVILPKLYRRLCVYSIYRKAGAMSLSFLQYLATKDDSDRLIRAADLKKFNAGLAKCRDEKEASAYRKKASIPLSSVVKAGKVTLSPETMVFLERPSLLVDDQKKEIRSF